MQAWSTNRSDSYIGRHRALVSALAIAILASLGFAAAGGIHIVKSWFVTTEVNGQVVDTREVVPDPNGETTFTVPAGDARDATVTVQSDGTEGGQKRVEVNVQGGAATVQVKEHKPGSGK